MLSEQIQAVDQAITGRHSVRAYLDKAVEKHIIQKIF